MKDSLLKYLVCPSCQSEFDCRVKLQDGEEIIEGQLRCGQCQRMFPIIRAIPRILPEDMMGEVLKTADAFGWEWQRFSKLHGLDEYRAQFLDWIIPLEPSFFKEKVVLDAGCGMGRFTLVASTFGARDVIAVDLSSAVEAARDNARSFSNVHVIQADIYNLPLRCDANSDVDFTYSIGVLHHLPDPERGFLSLVKHVKPGGSIFAWVYGLENNKWLVRFVNPMREKFFSRIPHSLLFCLSFMFALGLHPLLKLFYHPAHRLPSLSSVRDRLPYSAYLGWLSSFGFRHTHHVIFDHLAAPTAFYISREEFASWFERAGLRDVSITWRNQNSWRGLGHRPDGV